VVIPWHVWIFRWCNARRTAMNCGQQMRNYSRMEFQYDNKCRNRGDIVNRLKVLKGSECLLERHSVVKKAHEVKRSRPSIRIKFCAYHNNFNATLPGHMKSNPITDLNRPWAFQKFDAPIFQDNRRMNVVSLSTLRTGRLYTPRIYSW